MMRFVIGVVILVTASVSACDGGRSEIQEKMNESEFKCPPNATKRITGWGEIGLSRFCMTYNGPWQAWEDGVLRVDGYYIDNKEHGEWTWYAKDGSVEKNITYQHGVEVLPVHR